jgi:hypothetical protein
LSWPGIARRKTRVNALMSRPSTSCFEWRRKDVDVRLKAGHDAECWARSRHKDKDHD